MTAELFIRGPASINVPLPPAPAALFPQPLRTKHYLWAHNWEALGNGRYSHPGHAFDDAPVEYASGGFTEAEAIFDAQQLDAVCWQGVKGQSKKHSALGASILWEMAAYYAWLGENEDSVSPVAVDVIEAWAAGRVPSIASLLATEQHPCLELDAS